MDKASKRDNLLSAQADNRAQPRRRDFSRLRPMASATDGIRGRWHPRPMASAADGAPAET